MGYRIASHGLGGPANGTRHVFHHVEWYLKPMKNLIGHSHKIYGIIAPVGISFQAIIEVHRVYSWVRLIVTFLPW